MTPTPRQRRLWELTRIRRQVEAEIAAIERQIEAEQAALTRAVSAGNSWREESGLVAFLDDVATLLGTDLAALRSPQRRSEVARCRHLAAASANELGWSLKAIGRALNRDHATIHNSVRVVRESEVLTATMRTLVAPRVAPVEAAS